MDDVYVECLVARKANPASVIIKGLVYGLTVLFVLGGLFVNGIFFFGAIAAGLVIWLLFPMLSVEFEYLYITKSLTVDKIFSKEKRKTAAEYNLEKMEIFAEEGSWKLDEYKNLKTVSRDYTSGMADRNRWIMIVRNNDEVYKLYLEPNEEMIKALKNQFPQKTFSK